MTGHREPDLSVTVAGVSLNNPVMTASGTFGYGREFADLMDLKRLGAIVTKGISWAPREGNPPPRIWETPCGMVNAIGLQNVGVKRFVEEKLPFLASLGIPIVVNILGHSLKEYAQTAAFLGDQPGISALEINISCPNVAGGGMAFGAYPKTAAAVLAKVRKATSMPLIAKLTPQVTDMAVIARAVEEAGADALSLINTLPAMAVDIESRRSRLGRLSGGLSGPAVKPVALRLVYEAVRAVNIPVIGLGGIRTAEDALEFLMIGATAVQVGTANFIRPTAAVEIIEGIRAFLLRKKILRLTDWIGSFQEE
jgi:dihydroorotate dehydrogenase (NAD+) catalytic subunit